MILSDPSYQKQLLSSQQQEPETHGCGGPRRIKKKKTSAPVGISFAMLLAWIAVGMALVLAAMWFIAVIRKKLMLRMTDQESENGQKSMNTDVDLMRAEQLASVEKFTEAAHQILLLTLVRMAEKKGRTISSWMTSRELAGILPSGKDERDIFYQLVRTVETALFGGRQLRRSDYEQCLRDYRLLLGDL